MSVKQDWGNVWPGPRSFHPAAVPLPIRQGYPRKPHVPIPGKFANTELMKIPNFLHLTPPIIKRQCEALKKFCTPWPAGLETEEDIQEHYPIDYISSDYVHGLPTIRNPLARIVSVKVTTAPISHFLGNQPRLMQSLYRIILFIYSSNFRYYRWTLMPEISSCASWSIVTIQKPILLQLPLIDAH